MSYLSDYGQTILPLDWWRQAMGIDPYHFWQMTFTGHPMRGYSHIYPQRRWQYTEVQTAMPARDAKRGPSRYDIIEAMIKAEGMLAHYAPLNTWPGPTYVENEKVILTKPRQVTLYRQLPYGLTTKWHHIQNVGVETFDPITAGVVLTYTVGSDDVTCTVTTTVLAGEIVVCYPGETTQLRPITVTKIGNIATITIKRWLCADPDQWDTATPIDATDVTNLLGTVDVYRRWIDPSQQIVLAWEPGISGCGCLNTDSCAACQQATCYACAIRRDYTIGFVGWQASTWNVATGEYDRDTGCWPYNRHPDYAYISYEHGFPNDNQRYMSQRWVQTVAELAAANIPDYVTDTTTQPDILYHWREDMAVANDQGKHRIMDMGDLFTPFGTRRGQVEAWRAVKSALGD